MIRWICLWLTYSNTLSDMNWSIWSLYQELGLWRFRQICWKHRIWNWINIEIWTFTVLNSHVNVLIPKMMALEDKDFGKWWKKISDEYKLYFVSFLLHLAKVLQERMPKTVTGEFLQEGMAHVHLSSSSWP